MSGYLLHVAARSRGELEAVRPRIPSLFEPLPDEPIREVWSPAGPATAPAAPPHQDGPSPRSGRRSQSAGVPPARPSPAGGQEGNGGPEADVAAVSGRAVPDPASGHPATRSDAPRDRARQGWAREPRRPTGRHAEDHPASTEAGTVQQRDSGRSGTSRQPPAGSAGSIRPDPGAATRRLLGAPGRVPDLAATQIGTEGPQTPTPSQPASAARRPSGGGAVRESEPSPTAHIPGRLVGRDRWDTEEITGQEAVAPAVSEQGRPGNVRVTIGRVDVRAVTHPGPQPPSRPKPTEPALPLRDYLARYGRAPRGRR